MLRQYLQVEVFDDHSGGLLWPLLKLAVVGPSPKRAIFLLRLGQHLHGGGHRVLARLCFNRLSRNHGCMVSPNARIGLGLKLPHPVGVVIGDGVIVGDDVTVYQGVTLGGARIGDTVADRYPQIGNGCVVFAGAKVLGGVHLGDRCTVGANAVVLRDAPSGTTLVGVPAEARTGGPRAET